MGLISKIMKIVGMEKKTVDSKIASAGMVTKRQRNASIKPQPTRRSVIDPADKATAALRGISPKYVGITNERGYPIFSFLVPCPVCHRRALKHCRAGVCHERNQAFMNKCRMEAGWYKQMCDEVYL